MFEVLPSELIVVILTKLDFKDLISSYIISKRFKIIYDDNIVELLKLLLKDICVKNINSKKRLIDIYLHINTFNRIYYGSNYYIIGTDGKVYVKSDDKVTVLPDIENVISMSETRGGNYLFLRNDGLVYNCYKSAGKFVNQGLISKSKGIYLNDVIQVAQTDNYRLFLTSKGQVYQPSLYGCSKLILENVIKILCNNNQALFLQKNGNVCTLENNEVVVKFKNIKDILVSNILIVIIYHNNTISVFDGSFIPFSLDLQENINKVKICPDYLWILTDNFELCSYFFGYVCTNIVTYKVPNDILDFYPDDNGSYISTKSNELIFSHKMEKLNINGRMIDNKLVLIDNILYFIDGKVVDDVFKYDLVKIC